MYRVMSEQEIIEGNKLIAKFMGAIFHKDWTSVIYKTPQDTYEYITHPTPVSSKFWIAEEMSYHSSWDWLMPVVEMIENDCKAHICIYNKSCWIEFYGTHNDLCKFERTNNSFILNVYLAVVEFIKWKIMSE